GIPFRTSPPHRLEQSPAKIRHPLSVRICPIGSPCPHPKSNTLAPALSDSVHLRTIAAPISGFLATTYCSAISSYPLLRSTAPPDSLATSCAWILHPDASSARAVPHPVNHHRLARQPIPRSAQTLLTSLATM